MMYNSQSVRSQEIHDKFVLKALRAVSNLYQLAANWSQFAIHEFANW